jgi:hypothetical protein
MGYRKPINLVEVLMQIRAASYETSDLRTDSWVAWGLKQDLYEIKWALDEAIRRCPSFSPEDEWLKEQEKNRVIKILKEK